MVKILKRFDVTLEAKICSKHQKSACTHKQIFFSLGMDNLGIISVGISISNEHSSLVPGAVIIILQIALANSMQETRKN